MNLIDLTGQTFGRLTVLRKVPAWYLNGRSKTVFFCRCECGVEKPIPSQDLRSGRTVSCGCLKAKKVGDRRRIHGLSGTRTYFLWKAAQKRCTPDESFDAQDSMCPRWEDYAKFLEDMGEAPEGTTLHRINRMLPYRPDNCLWRPSHPHEVLVKPRLRGYTIGSRTQTLAQWASEVGISVQTLYYRLRVGIPLKRAIKLKPPRRNYKSNADHSSCATG